MTFQLREYPVLVGHCEVCGVPMMSHDRWKAIGGHAVAQWRYPGYRAHGGHGLCRAHYSRKVRTGSPTSKPEPKPVQTCSVDGCDRPHDARGLCHTHYQAAWKGGELETKPQIPADEVLDDWAMIRDSGETDLARAASRIGMTFAALDKALYRARKKGDPRGSLVPFAHDMRRQAA